MTQRNLLFAAVFALATAASGCLASSQQTRVAEAGVRRAPVSFEDATSRRVFVRAVQTRYRSGDARLSRTSWGIPFVYGSSDTTVLSENAFFNRQVDRADTDSNGVISAQEAVQYAEAR